ncbi:hypothetical protein B0T16DRAFT_450893 [Cercophora newfieldiana]|uniref:Cellobiose dehydrogenase-like cytochrome domain-containing protein n=1 Tax=Cercophora newfieldiana TaxID=92897 RepID=A0AA39YMC3_9PEZI|nr:hypothetical protein B0T16DRAFT_450893 [Cercophora newfieldiana]
MQGAKHLALLALAATASSESVKRETAKYCPGGTSICFSESRIEANDIVFRIAIPETTAAPFDILLQIVAPISVSWASIAWGGKMTANPLTVAWPNGNSAVVSSRWATGRVLPAAYAGATYAVLPTTQTNATHWQLDVLCTGCSQWASGSLNPNGAPTFAWAKGSRAPSNPALNTSNFAYHDSHGTFSHDLTAAKIPKGVFDALAYGLSEGTPASTVASVPPVVATSVATLPVPVPTVASSVASAEPTVATSVATLPAPGIPTSATLPLTSFSFVTGIPDVPLPTGGFPTTNLPTTNFLTNTIVQTSVAIIPAPAITRTTRTRTASAVVPTRVTVLPSPNEPRPTTFLVVTTRVTTILRPTSTRLVFPTTERAPSVVTVTVTRQSTQAAQPTQVGPPWAGGGGPPWVGKGKGKGKGKGWGGKGKGKRWGGWSEDETEEF